MRFSSCSNHYQGWVRAQETVTAFQAMERDLAQAEAYFKKASANLAADEEAAEKAYSPTQNSGMAGRPWSWRRASSKALCCSRILRRRRWQKLARLCITNASQMSAFSGQGPEGEL